MHDFIFSSSTRLILLATGIVFALTGCESMGSLGKKIDYKSVQSAPALEIPPDLMTPTYDDRYNVATASGAAARAATRPRDGGEIAPNITPEARIMRAGAERWLVVRATPQQAWNTTRAFWPEMGLCSPWRSPRLACWRDCENKAEVRRISANRRSICRPILFDVQARQVPHRIERGAGPTPSRCLASGMEQRRPSTQRLPAGFAGDEPQSGSRGRNADAADALRHVEAAATQAVRTGVTHPAADARRQGG
jgi:hypothetical protein